MLIFKEALLISVQASLGNYLGVSWEWWKMASEWLFWPALNCPPTNPANIRGKGRQTTQCKGSSSTSYLLSKDSNLPFLLFSVKHFAKCISTRQVPQETENTHHHLALWIQLPYSCICKRGWDDVSSIFLCGKKTKDILEVLGTLQASCKLRNVYKNESG